MHDCGSAEGFKSTGCIGKQTIFDDGAREAQDRAGGRHSSIAGGTIYARTAEHECIYSRVRSCVIGGLVVGCMATGGVLYFMAPISGRKQRHPSRDWEQGPAATKPPIARNGQDTAKEWISRGMTQGERMAREAVGGAMTPSTQCKIGGDEVNGSKSAMLRLRAICWRWPASD